ncbi:MAG: PAS domain-containing protein, partial [candidate division Zixibacteria bacterium]|nr:PAS domain-containing protein [candidate division Zixibacteria bacterium]
MTTQTGSQAISLTRCAVCKIDLKGRLVYVDDQVEQLLGRTREDLFGKPLHDFVDRASQELINSLLERRNHYETFYDATRVTLVHSEGRFTSAMAVVSLNFIGGNPVNFQLVLNPMEREEQVTARPNTAFDSKQFVADLIEVCSFSRWKDFLRTLCRLEGIAQAAVYLIRDGKLEPRSAASDDSAADFAYKAISATGKLHEEVAHTGSEYFLLDQEAVQAAVERHGAAPDEFVARLEFNENQIYLLRLLFAENTDRVRISEAVDNTRFAL